MLEFWSGSNEIVNSKKAMAACLADTPFGNPGAGSELLIVHSTMGHRFGDLITTAKQKSPNARIIGCTGCGVIGSNNFVSEKMRALAVMVVRGNADEFAISYSDKLSFEHSYEEALYVSQSLREQNANIRSILLIGSFLDFVADDVFAGVEKVFGRNIPIFGWTSTDNLKAIGSHQFVDNGILDHGLLAIGFADQTLSLVTGVHHGNQCIGEPFVVTRSERNQIFEFDGKPAWSFIMNRLSLPQDLKFEDALRVVCFGTMLPEEVHDEYDNQYIQYVPIGTDPRTQSFYMPVIIKPGTILSLSQRAEEKMFQGLDQMTANLIQRTNGKKPVVVFHSDCAARGRMSFNQILKNEIITRMQDVVCRHEEVPWLGLYGYGELAQLGGRNCFHNQTTSLFAFIRT